MFFGLNFVIQTFEYKLFMLQIDKQVSSKKSNL